MTKTGRTDEKDLAMTGTEEHPAWVFATLGSYRKTLEQIAALTAKVAELEKENVDLKKAFAMKTWEKNHFKSKVGRNKLVLKASRECIARQRKREDKKDVEIATLKAEKEKLEKGITKLQMKDETADDEAVSKAIAAIRDGVEKLAPRTTYPNCPKHRCWPCGCSTPKETVECIPRKEVLAIIEKFKEGK